jgi:Xaa-Pro aminopeptidase
VADVLVTADEAFVVTDAIEAERLQREQLPADLEVAAFPWAGPAERDAFVGSAAGGGDIASDLPSDGERRLPDELVAARRTLRDEEIGRYRAVCRDAALAMTETLNAVEPSATELDTAALGAAAMLRRGIDPALVLVAGASRIERFRHPTPTGAAIGDQVMVVFCGRRAGLYANLTRHVAFRQLTEGARQRARAVAEVEAAAWAASQPGAALGDIYAAIAAAYAASGHPGAERDHHQGGITGYLSREVLALPGAETRLEPPIALAWNPSLPGVKIEDTVIRSGDGLEILTVDPAWPTVEVSGRPRPAIRVVD